MTAQRDDASGVRIEGAVARPQTLRFAELASLPGQVEDVAALVAGRRGGAVRLRAVLDLAGPAAEATHLTVESTDGTFAASVPIDALAEAVLVYRLGHEPLPVGDGGAVRLLIPDAARCGRADVDACANVKHVGVIRVETARGRDTRPTTRAEHAAMHRHD